MAYIFVQERGKTPFKARIYDGADVEFSTGWEERYMPGCQPEAVRVYHIDGAYGGKGVWLFYNEELASSDGVSVLLFRETKHTNDDVRAAVDDAENSNDIVYLRVMSIDFNWLPTGYGMLA